MSDIPRWVELIRLINVHGVACHNAQSLGDDEVMKSYLDVKKELARIEKKTFTALLEPDSKIISARVRPKTWEDVI